jgi:hypothetical protein
LLLHFFFFELSALAKAFVNFAVNTTVRFVSAMAAASVMRNQRINLLPNSVFSLKDVVSRLCFLGQLACLHQYCISSFFNSQLLG